MTEIVHPILEKGKIIKAIIVALVVAGILLITTVLPVEYGIDPTGAGRKFGFSRLYNPPDATVTPTNMQQTFPLIKMEKAGSGPDVKRPPEADNPPPLNQLAEREDTVQVTVPAGKGIEYKTYMLKHGKMKYEWTTDKGPLYFDFHGEVKQVNESKAVFFESYTIAYAANMVGTFFAPFEGKHGWFFRNSGSADIVVTLRLKGQYSL